ncbi:hypothetical protein [Yoonia sp. R78084]|uniref:hypothetical protein n=1 Tax=Yoonia sp. R78084 TaxID=3093869 RepID=UPI0037DD65B6
MTADTHITESFRIRRVGGGLLIFIGLPLTLITVRFFAWSWAQNMLAVLFALTGPALVLAGLWAAFPRRKPMLRLTVSDDRITIHSLPATIPLDALQSIRHARPVLAKHNLLIFKTQTREITFNVINLTHEAPDIINLIGMRLEMLGRFLRETRSDVLGARTGLWEVVTGAAFEQRP